MNEISLKEGQSNYFQAVNSFEKILQSNNGHVPLLAGRRGRKR